MDSIWYQNPLRGQTTATLDGGLARNHLRGVSGIETMVEEGVVRSVSEGRARILIRRPSGCSSCAARGACVTLGPSERVVVVDVSDLDHPPLAGDRVKLEIRSATFLRATFLGYLLPTLAFFAGIAAVMLAVPGEGTLAGLPRDLGAFAAGIAGVVAVFLGLWIAGARPGAKARYAPRIVGVLPGPPPPDPG